MSQSTLLILAEGPRRNKIFGLQSLTYILHKKNSLELRGFLCVTLLDEKTGRTT